jgi:hypothetical protein
VDQEPDFTTYIDETFQSPISSSIPTPPFRQTLELSPRSPSHSPTPTPNDASYPPYPEDVCLQDFYWPDTFGTCFKHIRETLADYPICLFQRGGEPQLSYQDHLLALRRGVDNLCFDLEHKWRSGLAKKGLSLMDIEHQIGK